MSMLDRLARKLPTRWRTAWFRRKARRLVEKMDYERWSRS